MHFVLDFFRKTSIKTKLMFIAILMILYPMIFIGYLGYRNYADAMKEKAISDSQTNALDLSNQLSERMEMLRQFSIRFFYDGTIYNAHNKLLSGNVDWFSQISFQEYIHSALYSRNELREVLVSFPGQDKIYQVSRTSIAETDSYFLRDELHQSALRGKGSPVWYVEYKDGQAIGFYIAKLIFDMQDIKKEIGMIVFKVDEQYLFEVFNNFISHTNQNINIYESSGQEVFRHEGFKTDTPSRLTNSLSAYTNTEVKKVNIQNDNIYRLINTIQPVNWKVMVSISENVLLKEVRSIARLIVLLCIATLPVCIIIMNYIYIQIIRPMNLLIKRMRQIEKGDIGVTIEAKRMDEFGYVFRTFNTMSQEIKNLIHTVYLKQIAMKDAEIKALQAQINPHFLYNTLEAINWKAKINNVEEISEMVSALSSIIEANLNRNNETFIPVYREAVYINNYNFLIQKRFGSKIQFHMHIEEDVKNYVIPKLLVQPIIENAIYHGLEMKKGGGTVDISMRQEDGILLISVMDNGLGISEEKLKELKDLIADRNYLNNGRNGNQAESSSKIGVINVHRRIKLIYGKEYGLDIFSELGKGTTVTVRIPTSIPKGDEINV